MKTLALATVLALSLLAPPLAADGEQAGRVWRIGILGWIPLPDENPIRAALINGLRELGYVQGKNLVFERRSASPDPGRYPALAAELVAAGVDVIVTGDNQATLAVKSVTTTIPIVMAFSFDPVEAGIVASLARPGGNVTGLTWEQSPDVGGKRVQLFRELVPKVSRVAVVWNPTVGGLARYWPPFRTAASALRLELYPVAFSSGEELDRALATVLKDRPGAIFFWGDPISNLRRQPMCDFALKNRFPTLGTESLWVEAGCLISYAPDLLDNLRRTAIYVDKILKGMKPADLPIELPTKYNLVINGKTAKALRLTIPPSLLQQADQVIDP